MSRGHAGRTISRPGFFLLLLGLSGVVVCPTVRAEEERPAPTESGLTASLRRLLENRPWVMFRTPAGGGVSPSVGSFAEGSGPAPGLVYWNPRVRDTPIDLYASASHSFDDDELLELRVGRVPHRPGRPPTRNLLIESLAPYGFEGPDGGRPFFAYAELRWREIRRRTAFDPTATPRTFDVDDRILDGVLGYRLAPGLVGTFRLGRLSAWSASDLEDGAHAAAFDFVRGEAALTFDRRDSAAHPAGGGLVQLTWSRYAQLGGDGVRFDRLALDARRYVSLGSGRDVLALRGLASVDLGRDTRRVPLFLREGLGGRRTLRSEDAFRVVGPHLAAASLEYRHVFKSWIEGAVFADAGTAFGPGVAAAGRVRTSVGAGLRLRGESGFVLRLDAARGPEGTRVLCAFGQAF